MNRLNQVFWTITALDAMALVFFLIATLRDPNGRHDGGREMALFFFVMVPAAVLIVTALLFRFVDLRLVRYCALFIVAGPGLWFVWMQFDDLRIDRSIASHTSGAGFFKGDAMRAMAVAVVGHDLATVKRLGPTVDVNATGEDGMTLLKLAVDGAYGMAASRIDSLPSSSPERAARNADDAALVSALLALGAKPDQAMVSATKRRDPTVLRLLLEAGGDPNLRESDEPLVFVWLAVLKPDALRLLAAHGLDLNSTWHGQPLPVIATIHQHWDLLATLVELGADMDRPRDDGRNVRSELASQMAEFVGKGEPIPAPLAHVAALLRVPPGTAVAGGNR